MGEDAADSHCVCSCFHQGCCILRAPYASHTHDRYVIPYALSYFPDAFNGSLVDPASAHATFAPKGILKNWSVADPVHVYNWSHGIDGADSICSTLDYSLCYFSDVIHIWSKLDEKK